jgi:hypothetical protein
MERLRRFLHPASERKGILDTQRMHANAGSRHGNGTNSRPTTLNSQPNHVRRTSHTISTITIIVPTKPKPNIAPPDGHIGHQGYPCRHDRPGFRLSSEQNQTDHRNGIYARSVECIVVLIRFVAAHVCLPGHSAFQGRTLRANIYTAYCKGAGYYEGWR